MDFSPIVGQVLRALWWLFPIAVFVGLLKSPLAKGYLGELMVRILARLRLDKNIYHRLHNVTLPTADGTTQIDHVFVSRFGLFVVETKNLRGWIFGGEHQPEWTQRIYKQSFKFQNPLRQNFKHTKALETALQLPAATIHSVVTFIGDSTFKSAMPRNVTHGAGFITYIKSFCEPVFSETQVVALLRSLQSGRLAPSLATHRAHVRNLKRRTTSKPDRH